jgi:hypothetical protein
MSWQEVVSITVVLLGLGAGAFLVVQRPSFWISFGARLGQALLPTALEYITRRMPPEEEAAWRAAERRGQGDEWLKKRWRRSSDRSARSQVLIRIPLSHRPNSPTTRSTIELR